jgi:hypothetical protein
MPAPRFAKKPRWIAGVSLLGLTLVVAYALPAAKPPHHVPTMTNLPIDSLVKTLGSDVGKNGIGVTAGHNDAYSMGRFEANYSADFNAPPDVVHTMAMKIREVVTSRGAKVTGGSSNGDGFESLQFETDSATGWIGVIAAKSSRVDVDRLRVIVTEQHRDK